MFVAGCYRGLKVARCSDKVAKLATLLAIKQLKQRDTTGV